MKKLLLILLCFPFISFGQERINKLPQIKLINKSPKLQKATGWSYSTYHEKWYSCKNCIPEFRERRVFKNNYVLNGKLRENFTSIQSAKINSFEKYVFIIGEKTGKYKYPNLQMDWVWWVSNELYIMSPEEILQIPTLVNKAEGKNTTVRFPYYRHKKSKKKNAILLEISKMLNTVSYGEAKWHINSQILNGKHIVRFLPPNFSRDKDVDFEKTYYEVPAKDFIKIFKLKII